MLLMFSNKVNSLHTICFFFSRSSDWMSVHRLNHHLNKQGFLGQTQQRRKDESSTKKFLHFHIWKGSWLTKKKSEEGNTDAEKVRSEDAAFECSSFHLIRFQSLLHSSLLVVSPRISTADEGFNLIQLRPQLAPGILPDRPLLKRGKSHASILNLCVQELHWKLMAYSKRGASNLQPPLSSDFLSQSLLLQRSGSDFQLKPLILLTLEWFWFTLEQTLHKSQVRPEDPQELLDQRERPGSRQKQEGKRSQRRSDEYDKQQWTVWTSLPQVCSLVFRSLFWTFFFLHNHQEVSSHLKCEESCSLTLSFCWLLKKLLKAQWDTCCLQRTSWSWPRLWTWLICLSFMHSSPTSRRWVIPWSQAQDACCSLAFSPGLSLRCRPRTHRWDVRGG